MQFSKICWLGLAIGPLLMWQNALAVGSPSKPSGHQHVRVSRNHASGSHMREDYRSGYVAGLRDGRHVSTSKQRSDRDANSLERYAIRAQADRDARAERIYRSSQLSAPIILDAKACRRIGAHGESIYENCQLVETCNHRAGVATCQPRG